MTESRSPAKLPPRPAPGEGIRWAGPGRLGLALAAVLLPVLIGQQTPVTVQLPAAALFSINPRLDVTSTFFQPTGDRRQLGLVFYRVETRNGPGPALPAPWPFAALLLSAALVYAALRAATGRIRAAFA